jgi:hypothetical protein
MTIGAQTIDPGAYGGALWIFPSPTGNAVSINTTGLGNCLNCGKSQ